MTEPRIDQALAESVREVLEKMFFIDLLEPAVDGPVDGAAAELIFDGDPPGSFRLEWERAAATRAAADFLGEDPAELTAEQLDEVVCELANMICGSVLSRIESSATFRLSKPHAVSSAARAEAPPAAAFHATVGSGLFRAEIRMERLVCQGTGAFAS